MKSLKSRRFIANAVIYAILIIMSFIWLFPIVWLILQSFGGSMLDRGEWIPTTWTLDNYKYLLFGPGEDNYIGPWDGLFLQWFGQTLIIAIFACIISTIFVLGTSYALSRFRFSTRKAFMKLNLIMGMFPGFLGMIIIYWAIIAIDTAGVLEGNYLILIIIYSAGAGGGYYIAKGFFDTISKSIDEAAMIDGATRSQIFWKIILPLAKPVIVYTILTSFMAPWGEYITSSYLIGPDANNWTVAIGLYRMATDQTYSGLYYTQFAAGAVVVSIPITALFLTMQKYYVSGVTGGAVKG